jgi:hypothetical protein
VAFVLLLNFCKLGSLKQPNTVKKTIAIFFVVLSTFVYSQTSTEQKIIAAYGENWYNTEKIENPGQISILTKYVESGFKVMDVSTTKFADQPQTSQIPLRSKGADFLSVQDFFNMYNQPDFNPLLLGYFPTHQVQIIKLANVSKVIYIESIDNLLNR